MTEELQVPAPFYRAFPEGEIVCDRREVAGDPLDSLIAATRLLWEASVLLALAWWAWLWERR